MNQSPFKIVVVLDASGSMSHLRDATIHSFDNFISEQKTLPSEADLYLYKFSSIVTPATFTPLKSSVSLSNIGYFCIGGTALYDAIGKAISEQVKDNTSGILIIITDGEENSSKQYNKKDVSALIDEAQKKYGWEVIFLGANIANFKDFTSELNIKSVNSQIFDCSERGINQLYGNISSYTTAARIL